MKRFLIVMLMAFALGVSAATTDPNVAMMAIGLDGDQDTEFKVMMRRLNRSINEVITKERARNLGTMSTRELDKRIKKKIRRLYRDLDKSAEEIVREQQWEAYLAFKEVHKEDTLERDLVGKQQREI